MQLSALDWGLAGATVLALGLGLGLRRDASRPNYELLPDMARAPHYHAFEPNPHLPNGQTWQPAPAGTVARGALPLRYAATPEDAARAGRELVNPVPETDAAAVERGAAVYASKCAACHGGGGTGDGVIVRRGYPAPPSLLAPHARQLPDGHLFHIVTFGQGNMPAHGAQVDVLDRWRVIRFVRQLQAAAEEEAR